MADAQRLGLPGVDVEDTVHVLTRHGNVMGCYSMNQFQQPNETILTVVCRRGTVRYEPHLTRWRWMTEPNGPWHDEQLPPAERDAMFIYRQMRLSMRLKIGRNCCVRSMKGFRHSRLTWHYSTQSPLAPGIGFRLNSEW